MIRTVCRSLIPAALASLLSLTAAAQTGLAVRVGTLGPGVEISQQVLPILNLRLAGSYLPFSLPSYTLEDDDVDVQFDGDLSMATGALFADLFPLGGGLRLTAGVVYNSSTVEATGLPTEGYQLRSRNFSQSELGSLTASLEYGSKIAPYGGIGIGNAAGGGKIGFLLDIGVIYSGAPKITMIGTGMLSPTADQGPVVQDALDELKFYPVLSFGLAFRIR